VTRRMQVPQATSYRSRSSDRIKIAYVIDEIRWPTAGTENQLLRLIARLDRTRFLPYLVVLRSSPFLEHGWQECEVHSLDVRRLISARGMTAVLRLRRRQHHQFPGGPVV